MQNRNHILNKAHDPKLINLLNMKFPRIKLLTIFVYLLFSFNSTLAETTFQLESSQTSERESKSLQVRSNGIGVSQKKAIDNAVTAAIQQAVGQYVQAETIVANNEIIKDELLSYSAGYVERYNLIEHIVDNDGLHQVEILANVRSNQLLEKLKDLNIAVRSIDGSSLAAKSDTQRDMQRQGARLLTEIWEKYPSSAYKIEIDQVDSKASSNSGDMTTLTINGTVQIDSQYIHHQEEVLEQVAIETKNNIQFDRVLTLQDEYELPVTTLCFVEKSGFRIPASPHENHLSLFDRCYIVDHKVFVRGLTDAGLFKFKNNGSLAFYFNRGDAWLWTGHHGDLGESLLIEVVDQNEIALAKGISFLSGIWGTESYLWKDQGWPFAYDTVWKSGERYQFLFFVGSKLPFSISIDVETNKIADAASVVISVMDFR